MIKMLNYNKKQNKIKKKIMNWNKKSKQIKKNYKIQIKISQIMKIY